MLSILICSLFLGRGVCWVDVSGEQSASVRVVVEWSGCLHCFLWTKVVPSCGFFFFLTLIKRHRAVLLSIILSSSLSVCLLDWQPSYIPLLLYVLFCSFTTQWSVSVPKLCCSPFLNHCRPASCILHGTLPSIMRGGSGLGSSCQSACVCMSVCTYEAETEYVCVPIWTQTGSSIRASATTIEE